MPRARQTYSYVEEWKRGWEPELEAIAYNGTTCDPTRVDPKVLQWVQNNCSHGKPHFLKIINPNAAKGRPGLLLKNASSLTVPSPFVREHFRKLARVVTLENERGTRQWRVSFGAPKRDPQWLQGWDRVATDNNFQPGDVVVFVLVDDSRFQFTHFDADGNRLSGDSGLNANGAAVKPEFGVGRCSSQESHDQVHSVYNASSYSSVFVHQANRPTSEESPSCKKRKLQRESDSAAMEERKRDGVDDVTVFDPCAFSIKSKRRVTTVDERKRAEDAAMAFADTLIEPLFVAVMSAAQVYHEFHLVVPESFVAKACLPTTKTSATGLLVQDDGGHSWEMLMKRNRNNEVAFHRKFWALFAVHHLLEDGDVFVFSLTNQPIDRMAAVVMVVRTFRVVPVSAHQVSPHDHFALHRLGSATEQLGKQKLVDSVTRERCSGEEQSGKQGKNKRCFSEENGETATRKREKPRMLMFLPPATAIPERYQNLTRI